MKDQIECPRRNDFAGLFDSETKKDDRCAFEGGYGKIDNYHESLKAMENETNAVEENENGGAIQTYLRVMRIAK